MMNIRLTEAERSGSRGWRVCLNTRAFWLSRWSAKRLLLADSCACLFRFVLCGLAMLMGPVDAGAVVAQGHSSFHCEDYLLSISPSRGGVAHRRGDSIPVRRAVEGQHQPNTPFA